MKVITKADKPKLIVDPLPASIIQVVCAHLKVLSQGRLDSFNLFIKGILERKLENDKVLCLDMESIPQDECIELL